MFGYGIWCQSGFIDDLAVRNTWPFVEYFADALANDGRIWSHIVNPLFRLCVYLAFFLLTCQAGLCNVRTWKRRKPQRRKRKMTREQIKKLETIIGKIEALQHGITDQKTMDALRAAKDRLMALDR